MIVVITTKMLNHRSGRREETVSHGVDVDTGHNVCLPPLSLQEIGAVYSAELGEFVLRD